jgi:hypothetical protein
MIKIKEILLGIVISVIFLMFCVFGTKLIYDTPKYETYCDYNNMVPTAYDKMNLNDSELQAQDQAQQEIYKKCSENYEIANKKYSKNMFIISLIFGLLVIIICTIFVNINSISGGLMFGSLMFILYGTGRSWSYMDDLTRFIILGFSLGILIYVAYWISKKSEKSNKTRKKK